MSASQLVSIRKLQNRDLLRRRNAPKGTAHKWLLAFEHAYARQSIERRGIVAAMQADVSNDGRGQVTDASLGVNATEVRVSQRTWDGVSRNDGFLTANGSSVATEEAGHLEISRDLDHSYPLRTDATVKGMPAQGDCYSVTVPLWLIESVGAAEAFRMHRGKATVVTPPEKDARTASKPRKVEISAHDEHAAQLRSIAGTIRMGEQD